MALSREQKSAVVDDLTSLLGESRLTVIAQYTGLRVTDMQALRAQARENGTSVRVAKNRLFKLALQSNDTLKDADVSAITGQLVYGFNADDEIAPAQAFHEFAKTHKQLEFVGAISEDGQFMSAEEVKQLATLPSKDQLRGQLVGTIAAPLSGFVGVLDGNLRGLVTVLQARKEKLS